MAPASPKVGDWVRVQAMLLVRQDTSHGVNVLVGWTLLGSSRVWPAVSRLFHFQSELNSFLACRVWMGKLHSTSRVGCKKGIERIRVNRQKGVQTNLLLE